MHFCYRPGQRWLLLFLTLLSTLSLLYCLVRLEAVSLLTPAANLKAPVSDSAPGPAMAPASLLPSLVLATAAIASPAAAASPWTWTCNPTTTFCSREPYNAGSQQQQGEAMCRLECAPSSLLWPLPTSLSIPPGHVAAFGPNDITTSVEAPNVEVRGLVEAAVARRVEHLLSEGRPEGATGLHLKVSVAVAGEGLEVAGAEEGYKLNIAVDGWTVEATVTADSYFGARHGLETLFQLTVWDEASSTFNIATGVEVDDAPFFPHRGVMLDTARNFIPLDKIHQLVDSMSYSKLNVFHWHIVDTQSFPLVMPSLPGFSAWGAYRPDQVYSPEQVREVVEYARARGVQVIPELDAPAHVGAGWQAVAESLTTCVDREPWTDWCVEPPCGQLNPAIPELYSVLETIYSDWMDLFTPSTFHVGGDEVHLGCWNSTPSILSWLEAEGRGDTEDDFMFLWHHFLTESAASMDSAAASLGRAAPKLHLWSNQLTHPEHIHYLNKERYNIQIWSDATNLEDLTIKTVAEAGFKMIFSNYDATYLDCGYAAWVGNGNNWCSPYKQWQAQHQNDPLAILELQNVINLEEAKANVLGGEVAMWTENTSGQSVMAKIEPRASAYGERLWRGPLTGHWVEAERRLVIHRERLAARGVEADVMTHGWCRQNEGKCIIEESLGGPVP